MPFSISEQDTSKSLEKILRGKPCFSIRKCAFFSPLAPHTVRFWKSWIATIIPNDYIKTFLNYGYKSMFWTEMSDMSSYWIKKEKNDALEYRWPWGQFISKMIKVIAQSHQKLRLGSLAFSRLEKVARKPVFWSSFLPLTWDAEEQLRLIQGS